MVTIRLLLKLSQSSEDVTGPGEFTQGDSSQGWQAGTGCWPQPLSIWATGLLECPDTMTVGIHIASNPRNHGEVALLLMA